MDIRYALRMLARTPGFTVMAAASLALGIGITTIVFTVYSAIAFRQLSVKAPGEIERLQWHSDGFPSNEFSWSEYQRLASGARSFSSAIAISGQQTIVCKLPDAGPARTEIAHARFVSPNYFDALGIGAALGRTFAAGDIAAAVISHDYWLRNLESDPDIYGKAIMVQGTAVSIVGVAPESFTGSGMPPQVPDFWIVAAAQPRILPGLDWLRDASAREWQVLVRRNPRFTHQQVSAELAILGSAWPLENGKPVQLSALPATFFQIDTGEFQGFQAVCEILMIAVGLILLMVCVNLVNLITARNAARDQELAVRLALGASRFRLLRQLCSESLMLGLIGGAAGLALSTWACTWLSREAVDFTGRLTRGAFNFALDFAPDWHVFTWTAVLSVLTGVAVGLLPALRASARGVSAGLKQAAGLSAAVEITRKRNLLVSAQFACCVVLLTGSGLLFRGAARSIDTDPGFDFRHALLIAIDAHTLASTPAARAAIFERATARIRALPGVASIAWAERAPFLGHGTAPFFNESGSRLGSVFNRVSDSYFDTLRIPLLTGRTFSQGEMTHGARVAIISESTARRLWPGENPLGRRISTRVPYISGSNGQTWFTVVGVAKTVRSTFLSKADEGYVYIPKPLPDSYATLLVRTWGAPESALRPLTAELASINGNLPSLSYMAPLADTPMKLEQWMAGAPALVAGVLGVLAMLLACLGTFGVVSRLVALRTREIGLRIVLGANKRDVVRMVARQTLPSVLWGAGAGLIGAIGVSALLHSLIVLPDMPDLTYGAGAFDPVTFIAVLASLASLVMLAALGPVRRATGVEPAAALRDE